MRHPNASWRCLADLCLLLAALSVGCGLGDRTRPPTDPTGHTAEGVPLRARPCPPRAGRFARIYDPSQDKLWPWYINDHSIVRGPDQRWHLFGISHREPALPKAEEEFGHATSPSLRANDWQREGAALHADEALGETVLWAPHVLEHEGLYYMFYTGGGASGHAYQMRLATSPDLRHWTRRAEPLFVDGFEARDPFVMRLRGHWIMYYTATDDPHGGRHVVAYRTSRDLHAWSERAIAYRDEDEGKGAGPTESPRVVARPEGFYLFIGPYADYVSTAVYFSLDPVHFGGAPVAEIEAHAPEIVRDLDGTEYISRAGWGQGGVELAPLTWQCPR